jgi:predicted  nucleic acid-binding Zn-ribbon protein
MSSVTDTLRECHRLRKYIRELEKEIALGPRVLKSRQDALEAERQAHKDHHDAITKLKLKQREDEGTLKQTETRLAKLEDQLTGIGVQKEYEAKQSEIAQAKAKKEALEDAILATMTEIEEKTAAIPAVEKKWADAQAEFARYKVEAADRLEMLKKELETSTAALAKAEEGIPEDFKPRYEKLVKAHGPEAIAAVKNDTCQSCRTGLTAQRMIELRGGAFLQCPTCGKMLYPAE